MGTPVYCLHPWLLLSTWTFSPNLGPEYHQVKISPISNFSGSLKQPASNTDLNNYARRTIAYTKDKLFNLKAKYPISSDLYMLLKDHNLLRTRGVPSGLSVHNKIRGVPPISNPPQFYQHQEPKRRQSA